MVSELAEKRRSRVERHAAYVALARAILADDDPHTCQVEVDNRPSLHAA
jgi:hypothetical protein